MNVTDRAAAQQIETTITATGVNPPRAVTEAFDLAAKLAAGVRNLNAPPDALGHAVAAAIAADRDPSTDPDIRQVLVAGSLATQGIIQAVDGIASDQLRGACREHADTLITGWGKVFNTAAATLAKAHERIGDVALEDTATVLAAGGDVAEAWASAGDASKLIEVCTRGWLALATLTRLASQDPRYPVLLIAAVDYDTWMEKKLERRRLSAWEAVLERLTLSLPTFSEYAERIAVLNAGAAQAEREAEEAYVTAMTGRRSVQRLGAVL